VTAVFEEEVEGVVFEEEDIKEIAKRVVEEWKEFEDRVKEWEESALTPEQYEKRRKFFTAFIHAGNATWNKIQYYNLRVLSELFDVTYRKGRVILNREALKSILFQFVKDMYLELIERLEEDGIL
jgi:hypothetical protein